MELEKEIKATKDKLAAEFLKEAEKHLANIEDELREMQEQMYNEKEKKMQRIMEELKTKYQQESAAARDVVREEVAEGNTLLGYLWEGFKLVLPGAFSKLF